MIILVQKSCLHKLLQAKTRAARRSPTMRSSASTGGPPFFSQSPSTTAGLRRRVWRAGNFKGQLSASRPAIVFFFWSCVSKFNGNSFISHWSMPYVPQPCQYQENILTKWQPPIWLGYRKAGVLHAAPTPPTGRCTSMIFISNQMLFFTVD